MSDAPRKRDGDEVLASVRRLVTDDRTRPVRGADAAGRLVLTPQLRVAPPRPDGAAARPAAGSALPQARPATGGAAPPVGPAAGAGSPQAEAQPLSRSQPPVRVPRPAPSSPADPDTASPDATCLAPGSLALAAPMPSPVASVAAPVAARGTLRPGAPAEPFAEGRAHVQEPVGHGPGVGDAAPSVAASGEAAPAVPAAGAAGEALLDEAALRALIAEVVREELRGETGERVTRNLRKLIRAEIARALSGRSPH